MAGEALVCPSCGNYIQVPGQPIANTQQVTDKSSRTKLFVFAGIGAGLAIILGIGLLLHLSSRNGSRTSNTEVTQEHRPGADPKTRSEPESKITILAVSDKVDENLFLLRHLEKLYEEIPFHASDPASFSAASSELRAKVIRIATYIDQKPSLDQRLASSFKDLLELVDQYAALLHSYEQITMDAVQQKETDTMGATANAGMAGLDTMSHLAENEYLTDGEVIFGAAVAGLATYFTEANQKEERLMNVADRAIALENQKYFDQFNQTQASTEMLAQQMTAEYGWGSYEAGWNLADQTESSIAELVEGGNFGAAVSAMERLIPLRPRDAYLRFHRNIVQWQDLRNRKDGIAIMGVAEDMVQATTLIPEGQIYQQRRAYFYYAAATMAEEAAHFTRTTRLSPTKKGKRSEELFKTALQLHPLDGTGDIRYAYGILLLREGRLEEANQLLQQLIPSRENDPTFCFNYASLAGELGPQGVALNWLERALVLGYPNVKAIHTDPHFDRLRATLPTQFKNLLELKWTWKVEDRWIMSDDILLTNQSIYPLTDIVLTATVKKGSWRDRVRLTLPYLAPGQTHRWKNVVKSGDPSGEYVGSTATISCAQNR